MKERARGTKRQKNERKGRFGGEGSRGVENEEEIAGRDRVEREA